ncbi:putative transcription factor interactor and regulator CCHC(Zn) family [Helianthus anomalus]
MTGSDKVNSHLVENHENAKIQLTSAELQALVDNAVTRALERQINESSETQSRTLSTPHPKSKTHSVSHSKPPSVQPKSKKDDDRHSVSHSSAPSKKIVLDDAPRTKSCTYKYFVSCKPRDFTGEKGAVDCMTWLDEMDTVVDISGCAEKDVVKFVSQSFKGEALAWWRSLIQATGKIPLYNMSWDQFVALIKENYCPQHEVEKIESDFLSLVMKNLDCYAYLTSFNTLSRLVPYLVTPEPKRIARFIGGLAPEIKASVKASRPATFRSAADISLSLTLDAVRQRSLRTTDVEKRKREDDGSRRSEKKHKGNNDHRKGSGSKTSDQQLGDKPMCKVCKKHHFGRCKHESKSQSQQKLCGICKSPDHKALDCKKLKDATCFNCNEKGHLRPNCPKLAKKTEEGKKTNARVFRMDAREAVQDDNVITGTFLINDVFARVLFDSGADKSFVDDKFCELLRLPVKTLNVKYEVELADGTIETVSTMLDGCVISIRNHSFPLSLIPFKLADFDVVLGMDWLSHNQAQIVCSKKQVVIKTPSGEPLTIQGDTQHGLPKQIAMLKASKCLKKGCVIYMAHVTIGEENPESKISLSFLTTRKFSQKNYLVCHQIGM